MTKTRLAQIEHRLCNSTPGPWEFNAEPGPWKYDTFVYVPIYSSGELSVIGVTDELFMNKSDGEFIAHAWEDVADLLKEVRKLQEESL